MGVDECFKIAIRGLAANRLRSALTMLGVIIGVGAVITMTSIGQGAKKQVTSQIESLGSNLLIVMPGRMGGPPGQGGPRSARGSGNYLTNDLWERMKTECPSVAEVSPETSGYAVVKSDSLSTQTQVIGVAPGWSKVRNTKVTNGTFFTEDDMKAARKVAILGKTVVEDIFSGGNALGQSIRINGSRYTVIGILESKGQSTMTDNDDRVLVPLTTHQKKIEASTSVRTIYIQAKSEKHMDSAVNEVTRVLASKLESEQYYVRNQAELLTTAQGATNTLTFLLAGIAGVSLVVGGIGIMNIMLVSVTERTREIGLRKALGARRKDILLQFIIEAVTLSSIGGLLGVAIGVAGSAALSKVAGWQVAVDLPTMIIAVVFSGVVGLIFGVYPANQASRLNPIEALRFE